MPLSTHPTKPSIESTPPPVIGRHVPSLFVPFSLVFVAFGQSVHVILNSNSDALAALHHAAVALSHISDLIWLLITLPINSPLTESAKRSTSSAHSYYYLPLFPMMLMWCTCLQKTRTLSINSTMFSSSGLHRMRCACVWIVSSTRNSSRYECFTILSSYPFFES